MKMGSSPEIYIELAHEQFVKLKYLVVILFSKNKLKL